MKQKVIITSSSLKAITIKRNNKIAEGWVIIKDIHKCFGKYKLKMEKSHENYLFKR